MKGNIEESCIILVTHSRIYSASQALRDFLRERGCKHLLYVSHPLPLADVADIEHSYAETSKGSKILTRWVARLRSHNVIISSVLELCLTLWWVIRAKETFDLFIGVDNLNALEGLILKRLGRVRKVVYYTIDYFPIRFTQSWLNKLYHAIDKLCVGSCDETWNVSPVMIAARKKYNGIDQRVYNRQYTVPIGIWFDKIKRLPIAKIDRFKLMFSGHLVPHMGVDLLLEALPDIASVVPSVTLDIIGGGAELERLKTLAKRLGVARRVRFFGWVADRKRLEGLLTQAAVGVAPFNTNILDDKVRNADPGKLKDYMACGLAVVVTDAIANAMELEEQRCALVVPYRKEALVRAIVRLLKDQKLLTEYRKNAISYVSRFDYNRIFSEHLDRVLAS